MLSNSSLKNLVSSLSKFVITYPYFSMILSVAAYSSLNTFFSWLTPSASRLKNTNTLDEEDQGPKPSGPKSLRSSIKKSHTQQDLQVLSPRSGESRIRAASPHGSARDLDGDGWSVGECAKDGKEDAGTLVPHRDSPVKVSFAAADSSLSPRLSRLSLAFHNLSEQISQGSRALGKLHRDPDFAPSARASQELVALKVLCNNLNKLQTLCQSSVPAALEISSLLSSTQASFFYFALIASEDLARTIADSMRPHMIVVAQAFEAQGYSEWSSRALQVYPDYHALLQVPYNSEVMEVANLGNSDRDGSDLYASQTAIAYRHVQNAQKAFAPLFYLIPSLTQVFEIQCWQSLQSHLDILAHALHNPSYTLEHPVQHYRSLILPLQAAAFQVEAGASFSQSHPCQLLKAIQTLRQVQVTLKAHYEALNSYKKHTYSQVASTIPFASRISQDATAVVRASVLPPASALEAYMASSLVLQWPDLSQGYKVYPAPHIWTFTVESSLNTSHYLLSIQPRTGRESYLLTITTPQNSSVSKKDNPGVAESFVYEVSLEALNKMWRAIQGPSSPLCLSQHGSQGLIRSPSNKSVADPLSPTSIITRKKI